MMQMVETWWPLFVVALLLGIAIAWWIFASSRRTQVRDRSGSDVLEEGAAPAARNQALIDAAPAASMQPPVVPPGVAGAGTAVAAAVEAQQIQAAEEIEAVEAEARSTPAAPEPRAGDDLTRIKGIGGKLNELLVSLGVRNFAQIAAWNDTDIDGVDAQLGRFQGRIRRDNWVEQARLLAEGNTAGYEEKFGKL
jgi:predicted flap endonuclease-1-like 5' DNA nuclease